MCKGTSVQGGICADGCIFLRLHICMGVYVRRVDRTCARVSLQVCLGNMCCSFVLPSDQSSSVVCSQPNVECSLTGDGFFNPSRTRGSRWVPESGPGQ